MNTTTYRPEPGRQPALDAFERRYGRFGEREQRELPIVVDEVRDSRTQDGQFTLRGHAAVFDQFSLDLGGFREKIDRAAFDNVLDRNPDAWLLWDHDTRFVLARTTNKTLELRIDPRGLHYWARVAPTSYAADLRLLMERGDIDQASFAFTVKRDDWNIIEGEGGDEERVERTILEVGELYDVTVTAMGAYPQTDSQVVAERAIDYATTNGRLAGGARAAAERSGESTSVPIPREPLGEPDEPTLTGASTEDRTAPDVEPVGEEIRGPSTHDLAAMSRRSVQEMRERHLLAMKELLK
jgi:hypothetical protein